MRRVSFVLRCPFGCALVSQGVRATRGNSNPLEEMCKWFGESPPLAAPSCVCTPRTATLPLFHTLPTIPMLLWHMMHVLTRDHRFAAPTVPSHACTSENVFKPKERSVKSSGAERQSAQSAPAGDSAVVGDAASGNAGGSLAAAAAAGAAAAPAAAAAAAAGVSGTASALAAHTAPAAARMQLAPASEAALAQLSTCSDDRTAPARRSRSGSPVRQSGARGRSPTGGRRDGASHVAHSSSGTGATRSIAPAAMAAAVEVVEAGLGRGARATAGAAGAEAAGASVAAPRKAPTPPPPLQLPRVPLLPRPPAHRAPAALPSPLAPPPLPQLAASSLL
jgi:hypothetical protein